MTEDEAKTKLCHVTMAEAHPDGCQGSKCMAWRWKQKANPAWQARHQMMTGYQVNPYDEPHAGIDDLTSGYCGLAGSGGLR